MKKLREGIIRLFEQGKTGYQIAKDMGINEKTVYNTINRFQETGSADDKKRSGRPRTARTPANKRKIKSRIQRNKSTRKNSIRKMARAVGISIGTVHTILHEDLGANAWKEMKAHGLTDKAKEKRRIRCPRSVFLILKPTLFKTQKKICWRKTSTDLVHRRHKGRHRTSAQQPKRPTMVS